MCGGNTVQLFFDSGRQIDPLLDAPRRLPVERDNGQRCRRAPRAVFLATRQPCTEPEAPSAKRVCASILAQGPAEGSSFLADERGKARALSAARQRPVVLGNAASARAISMGLRAPTAGVDVDASPTGPAAAPLGARGSCVLVWLARTLVSPGGVLRRACRPSPPPAHLVGARSATASGGATAVVVPLATGAVARDGGPASDSFHLLRHAIEAAEAANSFAAVEAPSARGRFSSSAAPSAARADVLVMG